MCSKECIYKQFSSNFTLLFIIRPYTDIRKMQVYVISNLHIQGWPKISLFIVAITLPTSVANFIQYVCAKNYDNWLAVDKFITIINRFTFRSTM